MTGPATQPIARLTAQQTDALRYIAGHPLCGCVALGITLGTTAQGAAATAASLNRRGLVVLDVHHGRRAYHVTELGCVTNIELEEGT